MAMTNDERKAFLTSEIERGPITMDTAMTALAALSARTEMGGLGRFVMPQLMMAAAAADIARVSTSADEAADMFNAIATQAAEHLTNAIRVKFAADLRTVGNA